MYIHYIYFYLSISIIIFITLIPWASNCLNMVINSNEIIKVFFYLSIDNFIIENYLIYTNKF